MKLIAGGGLLVKVMSSVVSMIKVMAGDEPLVRSLVRSLVKLDKVIAGGGLLVIVMSSGGSLIEVMASGGSLIKSKTGKWLVRTGGGLMICTTLLFPIFVLQSLHVFFLTLQRFGSSLFSCIPYDCFLP